MEEDDYRIDEFNPIEICGTIIIHDMAAASDGGTIAMYCENNNKKFALTLLQHSFLDQPFTNGNTPGGLYLNGQLIDVRSIDEEQIIIGLKMAEVSEALYKIITNEEFAPDNINKFALKQAAQDVLKHLIEFIESELYIEVARKVRNLH